jgi:uncharacterized protein YbjT (DUF2867 family)
MESSPAKIFISGATGNVGAEVGKALQAMGISFRAGKSQDRLAAVRLSEGVEWVPFRFEDAATYPAAFQGIEAMFLMRPPQISNVKKLMVPAINAAIAAGVKRFVFLSLIGIENHPGVPHYAVEEYLRQSGVDYTFLRCSFFMQNMNTTHRDEIRLRDEIFIPAGKSRTSFIDARDIGAAAAVTLTQAGHAGKAYDLSGQEALDYAQMAEQFSQVLGRKITYRNPSSLAFIIRQLREGRPLPFVLVMATLYASTRTGMADAVTGDVEQLIGRTPILLRQYIEDYRQSWII